MKKRMLDRCFNSGRRADWIRARFAVPISRVQGISEEQMFKVVKTGTRAPNEVCNGAVLTFYRQENAKEGMETVRVRSLPQKLRR